MSFQSEGQFACKVVAAFWAESRFRAAEGVVEANVQVDDGNGQVGVWYGEFSPEVPQFDWNQEGKTRAQLTMDELTKYGVAQPHDIEKLVGLDITVTVKARTTADGKVYHDVKYLNSGARKLSGDELAAKMAAMFSAPAQQQAAPAAAPPAASAPAAAPPATTAPVAPAGTWQPPATGGAPYQPGVAPAAPAAAPAPAQQPMFPATPTA
jgi:hypothetical protein